MQLSTPKQASGANMLAGDVRTAFLLVGEARHRALARLFGVPREQEALLTLVVMLMLADAAADKLRRLLGGPAPASARDVVAGAAVLREALYGIAGPASRDTSMTGSLLVLALLGGAAAPAVARSLRAVRSSSHRLDVSFHHRYGYLVDPGHWRQRRAQRREDAASYRPASAAIVPALTAPTSRP